MEKARREEKSWELARMCRSEIEEMKKDSWFRNKEVRKEQERLEREKRDRFRVIGEKKKNQGNKQNLNVKQVTLTEMMKKLPQKEQEILAMEERRIRRLELQEMKQNVWRRWRGSTQTTDKRKETDGEKVERLTRRIEEKIEKIKEEKRNKDKKTREWLVRRKRLIEEARQKQEESERKNRDRKIRLDRKAKLEEQWEMLRWTVAFIDENKERWERERKEKENCRKMETISTWDLKTREEQKDSMREEWERSEMTDKEKWNMYRSLKVPTGAPKIGPSVALPGEMTCQQTQGDVDDLGVPVVTVPKVATQLGQSVAMQDVPRVSVTVPTRAPQPGLSVALPGEKILQQDHNFDNSIIVTVPIGAQLGLSVALQGDMMCQQDDPGVKTPGISQLGQSVAMPSKMMRQKDNPG